MSLEAAAGKNPVSHVGKLYNVLATLIARDIHAKVEGVVLPKVESAADLHAIGPVLTGPARAAGPLRRSPPR